MHIFKKWDLFINYDIVENLILSEVNMIKKLYIFYIKFSEKKLIFFIQNETFSEKWHIFEEEK